MGDWPRFCVYLTSRNTTGSLGGTRRVLSVPAVVTPDTGVTSRNDKGQRVNAAQSRTISKSPQDLHQARPQLTASPTYMLTREVPGQHPARGSCSVVLRSRSNLGSTHDR